VSNPKGKGREYSVFLVSDEGIREGLVVIHSRGEKGRILSCVKRGKGGLFFQIY